MSNLKKIKGHSKKIFNEKSTENERKCSCTRKEKCTIKGECLSNYVTYITTLTSSNKNYDPLTYNGICKTIFKLQYVNHEKSLNLEN